LNLLNYLPTLNQRVQGSSPCAPTNHLNNLADFLRAISTSSKAFISTNSPLSFSAQVSYVRPLAAAGLGAFDVDGLDAERLASLPGDGCAGFACHVLAESAFLFRPAVIVDREQARQGAIRERYSGQVLAITTVRTSRPVKP
jgi:hypothetical protein